jgi:hypothetical protein
MVHSIASTKHLRVSDARSWVIPRMVIDYYTPPGWMAGNGSDAQERPAFAVGSIA